MTPSRRAAETANKRAERKRRKEAGEVRVECWLPEDAIEILDAYERRTGYGRKDQIIYLIREYGRDHTR